MRGFRHLEVWGLRDLEFRSFRILGFRGLGWGFLGVRLWGPGVLNIFHGLKAAPLHAVNLKLIGS